MQKDNQNSDTLFVATKEPNGLMIDFVDKTSQRFSVPKHLILNSRFFPSDKVSLKLGGQTLEIVGKNLLPVHKAICNQKLVAIREGCPDREDENNFATWIDSIVVTQPNSSGGVLTIFPS